MKLMASTVFWLYLIRLKVTCKFAHKNLCIHNGHKGGIGTMMLESLCACEYI